MSDTKTPSLVNLKDDGDEDNDDIPVGSSPVYASFLDQCRFGKYESFDVWRSVFANHAWSAWIAIASLILFFFISVIGFNVYESHQNNAVLSDMKVEIDPERVFAQEMIKKTSSTLTSYIKSEFLYAFFFSILTTQTLVTYIVCLYFYEKTNLLNHAR